MGQSTVGFKPLCISLAAMLIVVYAFISLMSTGEDERVNSDKLRATEKYRKIREADKEGQDEMGMGNYNELLLESGKRFKLFEKKRLDHKKAAAFCRRREGKLAQAINIDEMRRLETLLMRARMIGDDMWIGADKKEWKRHAMRFPSQHFGLGPDPSMLGPDMRMLGGGPKEMCPALSSSTRSLFPVDCFRELPFICEFEPGKGKLIKKEKKKAKKEEMRKRREIETETLIPLPFPDEPLHSSPQSFSEISDSSESGEMTSSDDPIEPTLNTVKDDTVSSSETVGNNHEIGFRPHVIAQGDSHKEPTTESTNDVEETASNSPYSSIYSFLTTSTYSLSSSTEKEDEGNEKSSLSFSIPTSVPTSRASEAKKLLTSTENYQATTTLDPDQVMMDLIDEQSDNMRLTDEDFDLSTSDGKTNEKEDVSINNTETFGSANNISDLAINANITKTEDKPSGKKTSERKGTRRRENTVVKNRKPLLNPVDAFRGKKRELFTLDQHEDSSAEVESTKRSDFSSPSHLEISPDLEEEGDLTLINKLSLLMGNPTVYEEFPFEPNPFLSQHMRMGMDLDLDMDMGGEDPNELTFESE